MISLSNNFLRLTVSPLGAEWQSVKSVSKDTEYMWQGNPEYWSRRAPILFPIVGSLTNNFYNLNGVKYPMERHGFARNLSFEIVDHTQQAAELELCATENTLKLYPFHFSLRIRYEIIENTIVTKMVVFNPDSVTLPFSLGAHPAFYLQSGMENYSLEFEHHESTQRFFVRKGLVASESDLFETDGNEFHLHPDLFAEDALVFNSLKSKSILIKNGNRPLIKMEWDDSFSHFGIWAPQNCNRFVCLEPWAGVADALGFSGDFSTKEGIVILPPLQTKKFQFKCTFF